MTLEVPAHLTAAEFLSNRTRAPHTVVWHFVSRSIPTAACDVLRVVDTVGPKAPSATLEVMFKKLVDVEILIKENALPNSARFCILRSILLFEIISPSEFAYFAASKDSLLPSTSGGLIPCATGF